MLPPEIQLRQLRNIKIHFQRCSSGFYLQLCHGGRQQHQQRLELFAFFYSYSLFSSFHLTSKSNLIFNRYCTALEPTCASEKSREFAWNCIIQCSRLCSRLWCDVMHSVPTNSMWCCCFHLHGGGREFLPFVSALSENCWWLWESVHTINLVDLLCVLEESYESRESEVLLLFRFYLLKTNHKLRVASSILYEREMREKRWKCAGKASTTGKQAVKPTKWNWQRKRNPAQHSGGGRTSKGMKNTPVKTLRIQKTKKKESWRSEKKEN